jgi:hypothetical protein
MAAALPIVLVVLFQRCSGSGRSRSSRHSWIWLPQPPFPASTRLNAMVLGVFGAWFIGRVFARQLIHAAHGSAGPWSAWW